MQDKLHKYESLTYSYIIVLKKNKKKKQLSCINQVTEISPQLLRLKSSAL